MKKIGKIFIMFTLAFVVGLALVACVKEDDNRTVITYAAWDLGNVDDVNLERKMIDEFMLKYPDI